MAYVQLLTTGRLSAVRFDPATDNILVGGEGGVPWDTGASASKKGFAPRVGLAYRLFDLRHPRLHGRGPRPRRICEITGQRQPGHRLKSDSVHG